jgi:hypothetical protein
MGLFDCFLPQADKINKRLAHTKRLAHGMGITAESISAKKAADDKEVQKMLKNTARKIYQEQLLYTRLNKLQK